MQDHEEDIWWIGGIDKYLSFLKSNSLILDIGCGAAIKSKYLIKKGFRVIGIDFSEEMIALAKEQASAGHFFVKDIKQPLDLEKIFDGVLAHAVLLHIPKKEVPDVLKNIIAPLKPDGYFCVAVKEQKPGNFDEELLKENDYGYEYERFFSYYTLEEMENYVINVGLHIVYKNITTSGKTNWIQIIAKK